jgi:hypothetical protein
VAELAQVVKLEYETCTCCVCGIEVCLPKHFEAQRRRDHKMFWCPNGHQQHFTGKTNEDKLKEELEQERLRTRRAEEDAAYQATMRKREARAAKGKMTKLRHRIGHGLCPCCRRTFSNVQEHMEKLHPELKLPEPDIAPSS